MEMGERALMGTVMGKLTEQEGLDLALLHTLVCRRITCPTSGKILDSRTAVMFEVGGAAIVVHPSAEETADEVLRESFPDKEIRMVRAKDIVAKL